MSNSEPQIDPATDPGLAHFIDLIRMLPSPTRNPELWRRIQSSDQGDLRHVRKEMHVVFHMLRQPTPRTITTVALSMLWFFSGQESDLCSALNALVDSDASSWGRREFGRWWAEDMTRTAWRLYVRYQRYADTEWINDWRMGGPPA